MRLNTFMQIYTMMLRSADALMPYGAPKATPDVTQTNVTQIVVAGGAAPAVQAADRARDVTPGARRIGPPPMPHEIQKNQQVADSAFASVGRNIRTNDDDR